MAKHHHVANDPEECSVCLHTEIATLQTQLRDVTEERDGMRREGCAAIGLVQNIFNGLTAKGIPSDPKLKQMADACAKLLTEATQCDHKAKAERPKREGAMSELPDLMTVHVYTGNHWTQEEQNWPIDVLEGEVDWDMGGVRVRIPDGAGAQVWQVPWSAVKYITWREDFPDG